MAFVDFYSEKIIRLWVRLVPNGVDLFPEQHGEDSIGTPPKWWEYEIEQGGIEDLINPPWCGQKWTRFALRNGLAPRQPFCMEFSDPVYSKTWTDCGYEYDFELDRCVFAIEQWPHGRVRDRWAAWLRTQERTRKAIEADRERFRREVRERTDLMFVQSYVYFARSPGWDDMAVPDGVGLRLCSKLENRHAVIANGRDDDGGWSIAMARLAEDASKQTKLTAAEIEKLPRWHA